MITIEINEIRPVAQQIADGLAGDWTIANYNAPYTLVEEHELAEYWQWDGMLLTPGAGMGEKEMLLLLEDNIRNGEHLSE